MSAEAVRIGRKIATARKARGLSQQELADRLHVSKSLLGKVERGARTATPALVAAVARALGRAAAELTGEFVSQPHQGEQAGGAIRDIRRAVACYDVAPDIEIPIRPLSHLRDDMRRVSRMRHEARLRSLGDVLPGFIWELTALAHRSERDERSAVFALLVDAYSAANQVAYKLGYDDLSGLLVERVRWAASRVDDPLVGNLAEWMQAGALRSLGLYDQSYGVLDRALSGFGTPGRLDPRQLSMYGSLHLQSTLTAASAHKSELAKTHLHQATEAASLLHVDSNCFDLSFGPSNVAIYRVAAAVALRDGTLAVSEARRTHLTPALPKERAAYYRMDVARGWLLHGDGQRALRYLLAAEKIAPEQTRAHPGVHETVRSLVERERRSNEALAGLARRARIAS